MKTTPNILIFDIESLPNEGYFFDCFSDRGIPTQFISRPKAVCTIAYKWMGEGKTKVLIAAEPYNDAQLLLDFMTIWDQADYVIAHFGSGFDIPFLAGRLLANGLNPLAPVPVIDTYRLAKKHFGRTLNSNRLDHLGEVLNLGKKNKTDASLWVRCAQGEKKAIKEMAAYNIQDVDLLEKIAETMLPHASTKLNRNLFSDNSELICSHCGGNHLQSRGTIVTKSTKKTRLHCQDCGAWSTTKYEKTEVKAPKPRRQTGNKTPPQSRSR